VCSNPKLQHTLQKDVLFHVSKSLHIECQVTYLLLLVDLGSEHQGRLHERGGLSLIEKVCVLLDIQLKLAGNIICVGIQEVHFLSGARELIITKALQLGIESRHRSAVTLQSTESHEGVALLKVSNLDAARVVLELDLVLDAVGVMVGKC
jgi:hypothetical protein